MKYDRSFVMGKGYVNDSDLKIYYVYAWYFKDTGEIFHIGKGKNNRYKDTKCHRNQFFLNIINKHKDNVDVKFLLTNLTNNESLKHEKELIKYYKSIGQCKTNFHEGGCGGYTGNYKSPERSKKLSIAARKRVGEKNPMFGHTHTLEARKKISDANKGKVLSKDHIEKLRKVNTGRIKTPEERHKLSVANKGKIVSKKSIVKGIKTQAIGVYELSYDSKIFAACVSYATLIKLCKKDLGISSSILEKICNKTFIPKFNRHKWINALNIQTYDTAKYVHLDEYFIESPIKILDQIQFDYVKQLVKCEKDKADLLRYGTTNPSIRK